MSVGDKLKDIYFAGEEKWYGFLDKVDQHVPVYKVIDRIDEVVPSFALLIVLLLIIILLITISSFGLVANQEAILRLNIIDNDGAGISDAQITIDGIDDTFYSNNFGLVSDISVPYGYTVSVTARKDGKYKTVPIKINFSETESEITLPVDKINFSSKTVQIVNANGTLVTDSLKLDYSCSAGVAPDSTFITNGVANVNVPGDCGILSLTISSQKYKQKTITITNASTTITLEDDIRETGQAIITLKFENAIITENVEVMAMKASSSYLPEETIAVSNGIASFTLPEGDYIFQTKQSFGYKQATSARVTVSKNSPANQTIDLTKDVIGSINVIVKKGSIKTKDVLVTLRKTTELDRDTTDSNGSVEFQLAENGPFIVNATEDGYCEESKSANIGDTITFILKLDTGSCGGELKVKVVDQDDKAIQYARVILFGETDEDAYKLSYTDKRTDYNGETSWSPVSYSKDGEKYKAFAYKGDYSGWSTATTFTSITASNELLIKLDLPEGLVNINVKDNDGLAIKFAEVQLFEDFGNNNVTGKKLTEVNGSISFAVKAGQRIYAVVQKEGYESYMSLPKIVNGNGSINFDIVLSRPPVEELSVNSLGLYKDGSQVLRAEAGAEYLALFEVITPKRYEELGFFVRAGKDNVTKTELDKVFIKEIIAPGEKIYNTDTLDTRTLYGASYNQPKGYNIDADYLNLEESKWGQVVWTENGYVPGKIIVGVRVKIRENAKQNEQLELGFRAWGYDAGYERDPVDNILGTSASNSNKNALYATTKTQFIWVGTESLCESQGEHSFCITSTVTDSDGITSSFDTTLEAKNNSEYDLSIKVYNNSTRNFDVSKVLLDNTEDNLFLGTYGLLKPNGSVTSATVNGYSTSWIDTGAFKKQTEIQFTSLKVTPQKTGYAPLLLRLRDTDSILFEKIFNINVASDKKMKVEFMYDSKYQNEVPKLVSGQKQNLTIRAKNATNNLEINDAYVKLYDRFGTKIAEKQTNSLGIATLEIPASLPGEELRLNIEKSEYETSITNFKISEDVINVTPETLAFTVNPQTNPESIKLVKIENKTGFNLKIKSIAFKGKTKGLLSETQMDAWFALFVGKEIKQNDYEELEFKVVSSPIIPSADDLEGTFVIAVTNGVKTWVKEVDTKIRVGLGKDVDNPECLEITNAVWNASTQGEEIEIGLDIRNNCLAEGQPVKLTNLGAKLVPNSNNTGVFSASTTGAYTGLSRGYTRVFKTSVDGQETTPITIRFTPMGGMSGTTDGTIVFEAINKTDSKDQILSATLEYKINVIDSSCLVIGADLVSVPDEGEASFSITNSCPESASLNIETELQLSNKIITLASGASQDVTITRNEGDVPGAYNNLVYGRVGNGKNELIGNVKAILDSGNSCFKLSRYEYDVYDSPYNDNDGSDTGYLRNTCTSKTVTAAVSGQEDFDWDKVMSDMLVGAVAGGLMNGKILPGKLDGKAASFIGRIFGGNKNDKASLSKDNDTAKNEVLKRHAFDMAATKAAIVRNNDKLGGIIDTVTKNVESKTTLISKEQKSSTENLEFKKCAAKIVTELGKDKASLTQIKKTVEEEYTKINKKFDEKMVSLDKDFKETYNDAVDKIKKNETDREKLTLKYETAVQKLNTEYEKEIAIHNKKQLEIDADFAKDIKKITGYTNSKEYTECISKSADAQTIENKFALEDLKTKLELLYEEINDKKLYVSEKIKQTPDPQCTAASKDVEKVLTAKLEKINELINEINNAESPISKEFVKTLTTKIDKTISDFSDDEKELTKFSQACKQAEITSEYLEHERVTSAFLTELQKEDSKLSESLPEVKITSPSAEPATEKVINPAKIETLAKTEELPAVNATSIETTTPNTKITEWKALAETKLNGLYPSDEYTLTTTADTTTAFALVISPKDTSEKVLEQIGIAFSQNDGYRDSGFTIQHNYLENNEKKQQTEFVKEDQHIFIISYINGNLQGPSVTDPSNANTSNENLLTQLKTNLKNIYPTINPDNEVEGIVEKIETFKSSNIYSFKDKSIIVVTPNVQEGLKVINITNQVIQGMGLKENELYIHNYNLINEKKYNAFSILNASSTGLGDKIKELANNQIPNGIRANFILASRGVNLGDALARNLVNVASGGMGGSAVGGGLVAGMLSMLQGQELLVNYNDSFNVDLVTIGDVSLQSEGGVTMSASETTFDYDDYYQSGGASAAVVNTDYATTGTGYSYNPSAMSATVGLTQVKELTFVGAGETNDSPYTPFTGILTVSGTEKVYNTDYTYDAIKIAAKTRGTYKTNKGNWFQELFDPTPQEQATMSDEDLTIKETRNYEKKFHLLFDSFQYVDCGPKTYPCQPIQEANCKVGNKTGITGPDAVPKVKLDWSWSGIAADECDETNANYSYCDITQVTLSTMKKILYLKDFFMTTPLPNCPSTLDIAGTTTQELSTNSIDVALTQMEFNEVGSTVTIQNRIETNNNLDLQAGLVYTITRNDGTMVANTCDTTKKTVKSYLDYSCTLNKSDIGTGEFNVNVDLDLELCDDCENTISTNDSIQSKMILGQEGIQNCEEYSTQSRNYFEKVLSANDILNSASGQTAINYVSFTINMEKDGFSEDFRSDFDNYLMQFASAPQEYQADLRDLFMNKFEVSGPGGRDYWEAGKFKATLAIEFNDKSWSWNDANDIKSITLNLEPWAEPDIDQAIYDVPFNGTVGLLSDNGRNGYGAGYNQKSEKPITIIEGSGSRATIKTETDPASNALTTVNVEYDESFYTMNSWNSGRRGNVLTINRTGNVIDLILSPSIAVPIILNISNDSAVDAYAYYTVEVNGQPQNVGPVLITWTGIGQGCVDFGGSAMSTWDESADSLNESGDGYGLRWNNVIARGTASLKGVFYVPEQSSSAIIINSASQSGSFQSSYGNGTSVVIDSGVGIRSIQEVFDAVANEDVCVAGGHYFWNNKQAMTAIQATVNEKENSCITIG
ncbi:MAG: hypothetical protein WC915_02115 [archaeon]|jgi:hypothetical protein